MNGRNDSLYLSVTTTGFVGCGLPPVHLRGYFEFAAVRRRDPPMVVLLFHTARPDQARLLLIFGNLGLCY